MSQSSAINLPIITAIPDDIRELLEQYSCIAPEDVIPHITAVVGVSALFVASASRVENGMVV
jgi:hypothetical protein